MDSLITVPDNPARDRASLCRLFHNHGVAEMNIHRFFLRLAENLPSAYNYQNPDCPYNILHLLFSASNFVFSEVLYLPEIGRAHV